MIETTIAIAVFVCFGLFISMMAQREDKLAYKRRYEVEWHKNKALRQKITYVVNCFGEDGEKTSKHWDDVISKADEI